MGRKGRLSSAFAAAAVLLVGQLWAAGSVSSHPGQHGPTEGHLTGSGAFGNIDLLSVERLTTKPELVADVAVSPDGQWAFLANWGEPSQAPLPDPRSFPPRTRIYRKSVLGEPHAQ